MPSQTTLYKKLQKTDSSFNSTIAEFLVRMKIQKDPNRILTQNPLKCFSGSCVRTLRQGCQYPVQQI